MLHTLRGPRTSRRGLTLFTAVLALTVVGTGTWAFITDEAEVDLVHDPVAAHADQAELNGLPASERFTEAFELGDELFATAFNALDGAGANVGAGQRFTRVPRADLDGAGQWKKHTPARVTGPNAAGCFECHESPFEDGAGTPAQNVHRDPFRTGVIGQFVQRNTPHVFAMGAVQRLAEEMSDALELIQRRLERETCGLGGTRTAQLVAKGVRFGTLGATRRTASPCAVTFDTAAVRGVDFQGSIDNPDAPPSLIVRPFQWKGSVAFIRDFNRGAAHNELGMQSVEIVGEGVDGDFDGVIDELTFGDQTALSIYLAAQPRPTTLLELNRLGLLEPALTRAQIGSISRGRQVFSAIGCASCHVPSLPLENPMFSEPSQHAAYRDGEAFPAGQSTTAVGVDPRRPVTFDLTRDQPDNILRDATGRVRARLGSFTDRDNAGRVVVELFGDLKRHAMGSRLAESVNEIAGDDVTPIPLSPRNRHTPDTFLTENLWGVGSTAPYMHDGRATTLVEAILEHASADNDTASEARASRAAYRATPDGDKRALIAFLENLVLFKVEEEEEGAVEPAAPKVRVAPRGFRIRFPGR